MTKPPAFQLYARDIYTGCSDMSGDEFGAYVRAMCWSWDNGPLPLDLSRVARLMLVERADFDRIWEIVGPNWQRTPEGFVNARLESQREELEAFRAQCSQAGIKSGESRRRKRTDVRTDVHTDVATNLRTEHPTEREPEGQRNTNTPISDLLSPSSSAPATPKAKTPRGKRAEPVPLEGFDAFWLAYPLKVAKDDAIKAWNKLAPSESLREFIGAALIWQRPRLTFEKDGQVKGTYPASWLNGRRWEDERPPAVTTRASAAALLSPKDIRHMAHQLGPRSWAAECVREHAAQCGDKDAHDNRIVRELSVSA